MPQVLPRPLTSAAHIPGGCGHLDAGTPSRRPLNRRTAPMRTSRLLVATAAISLSVTALVSTTGASTAVGETTAATTAKTSYVVLADKGYSAKALADTLRARGATVTKINRAIGMVTVTSTRAGFATQTRRLDNVAGVARNRAVGMAPPTPINYAPKPRPFDRSRANGTGQIPAPPAGH